MLYQQFFDGPGLLCANTCSAQMPTSFEVDQFQSLQQQELGRERARRAQLERRLDVRLESNSGLALTTLPAQEAPCFPIATFELKGEQSDPFQWALQAATRKTDPPPKPSVSSQGAHCLRAKDMNIAMARVQSGSIL